MKILVTGSTGLIGRALCCSLDSMGAKVIGAARQSTAPFEVSVGNIDGETDWSAILNSSVDTVVHLAGKVPLSNTMAETNQYRLINTLATENLARQCAEKGIRRFVFLSTVKVLGEGKTEAFNWDDPAAPVDAYSASKWEAEQIIRQISLKSDMEVVIIRPPLVYGPGVKGNFLRLMKMVDKGLPLPFGAIHNLRSFIYVDNLVDIIRLCITHPNAIGKTFLVSDNDDVSTPELIRRLADALNRKPILLPIPANWMKSVSYLLGRQTAVERVFGSLTVNTLPLQQELNWKPLFTMQEGLKATAAWYGNAWGNR